MDYPTKVTCPDYDWEVGEVHQLREDVEELELELAGAFSSLEKMTGKSDKWMSKHYRLKEQMKDRLGSENGVLTNKLIVYGDIILEYRKIVAQYANHTGISLVTNKIKDLEVKGGLSA